MRKGQEHRRKARLEYADSEVLLHAFFINIGGSLLTAFRAALGAMIGFLIAWCFRDVEEMSAAGVAGAIGYAALTLVVCVGLAWADELLRNPHAVSRYS